MREQDRRLSRAKVNYAWGALALGLLVTLAACTIGSGSTAPMPAPAATATGSTSAPTASTAVLTYVAVGASDAFGIGTANPSRDSWPVVLSRTLGAAGRQVHLVNLGIPGATAELAARDELPVALDATPAIATIWLGVNDLDQGVSLDTYTQNMRAMVHALVLSGNTHVFVGNLPELSLLPYFTARQSPVMLRQETARWNAAIAAACVAEGATLVDIFAGWSELASHPDYISRDGLHPSSAGAERIAALFATAIHASGG